MKIRNSIALLFFGITAVLLLVFAMLIYYAAANNRENEFYDMLVKEANTKASVLLNAGVDASTLQTIYSTNRKLINEVEVAIYDTDFKLLYHDAVENDIVKESNTMLDSIIGLGNIRTSTGLYQITGSVFEHQQVKYIVTAAAYDGYGYAKLNNLRSTLVGLWLGSIIITLLLGRYMAGRLLNPISSIIHQAKRITATNLNLRLPEGNRKDELAEMAITFNQMLNRLEQSFDAQKHFVSHISHELRTPLTAMIAELEWLQSRERDIQTYKDAHQRLLQDISRMNRLVNSLLDLATASYDTTRIQFARVRIDEILLDAHKRTLKARPDAEITLYFEQEDYPEDYFTVYGNEYLIEIALANLMDNACKFSYDKACKVKLSQYQQQISIEFTDNGTGIPPEEADVIFEAFGRGRQQKNTEGYGIGLALCKKIALIHGGDLRLIRSDNQGSTFGIRFPLTKNTF
jgi:signal transduction histidine kinase